MASGKAMEAETARVSAVAEALRDIRLRADRAARAHGRDGGAVRLVGVTKGHGADVVAAGLACGIADFGENRVQEAEGKFASFIGGTGNGDRDGAGGDGEDDSDSDGRGNFSLHMIGGLQSNKAGLAAGLFDWIHTLDRESLAVALSAERARGARLPRLLVQVNTGEEAQKSGVLPGELDGFLDRCEGEWGLAVEGLMCLPPMGESAAPHFALLSEMARRRGLRELSMGMSGDFEAAVALGATMVRVGTSLFGPRPPTL